jgi:hypothetical protein
MTLGSGLTSVKGNRGENYEKAQLFDICLLFTNRQIRTFTGVFEVSMTFKLQFGLDLFNAFICFLEEHLFNSSFDMISYR